MYDDLNIDTRAICSHDRTTSMVCPGLTSPGAGGPLAEAKPKKLLVFDAIGPASAAPGRGGDPPAIPAPNLKCRRRRRAAGTHPRAAGLTGPVKMEA
jgi:hypothetical protein